LPTIGKSSIGIPHTNRRTRRPARCHGHGPGDSDGATHERGSAI
jgi:hypothetical protein